jgi:3-methylcrotonyl-CoA carboxylase beta subunit
MTKFNKENTMFKVSAEDLGGADLHCSQSGVTDYYAQNDMHAIQLTRQIVEGLPLEEGNIDNLPSEGEFDDYEEPLCSPEEIYGIVGTNLRKSYDVREVIARFVDGSRFDEFKQMYGSTLVTGFAKLFGQKIGILGKKKADKN